MGNTTAFSRRMIVLAIFVIASAATVVHAQTVLPRGHTLFTANFEGPSPLAVWSGPGKLDAGYRSQKAACVERLDGPAPGSKMLLISLPPERIRGYTVYAKAMVKAQNVSAKPLPWNGVKFMMQVDSPRGASWPAAQFDADSFDWQSAGFAARIPDDASRVLLFVGLEAVTGKAWFDDLRVYVGKTPRPPQTRPAAQRLYKGHDLPRLRGTMINPSIDEASLRTLGKEWNANVLRWQLIRYVAPAYRYTPAHYDQWLQGELRKLDAALPLCQKHGLHVVVDLHSPPGGSRTASGYVGSDDRLFTDKACQDKFVQVWEHIARRYKDATPIWGYDLANEPVEGIVEDGCDDWHDLAQRVGKAIRVIDAQRALIVEPTEWGSPLGFATLYPIDVPNVVYSVHMYVPATFTHQNVFGKGPPVRYPGQIDGTQWDRSAIEAALKPVVEFQKAYGAHIYVGEFSAIRWAPDNSAYRYLKDVIDVFEANGWDWTYHAFREWQGWSVEHGGDRNDISPATQPTDRQRLLCDWFSRNQKPRW